jgi:hypothetical protein
VRSNNRFKEVRFKIRDSPFQMYQDMALYFFDRKVIDKPTIHEYARWCIKQITDYNAVNMFQWKLTRAAQMQDQQRMFEKQNQFNHMPQPSSNAKNYP